MKINGEKLIIIREIRSLFLLILYCRLRNQIPSHAAPLMSFTYMSCEAVRANARAVKLSESFVLEA